MAPRSSYWLRFTTLSSAITIFLSAFLLFLVEPLVAKKIVPWFGGSAAVWAVCLVFFQTALLLGYLYSRALTHLFPPKIQALIHIALILMSLWLLPVGPGAEWRPGPLQDPSWFILEMLTAALGLLFILLSSTGPLLQHWLARGGSQTPYRLFALSNVASLGALLSYPVLIEPSFDTRLQSLGWSAGYGAFALLCGLCAAFLARTHAASAGHAIPSAEVLGASVTWRWFALAACGSMLLLSITNHLSENVAAVPLLWILPLSIYLLTFVLAFSSKHFYSRGLGTRFLAVALGLVAYAIYNIRSIGNMVVSLSVFLFALFVGCLFCHGELYCSRPPAAKLTTFYLVVAQGGAAGAIFVGIVAPRVFAGVYELPLTLSLIAALAILCTWPDGDWTVRIFWIAITCCMLVVFGSYRNFFGRNAIYMNRSFYGSLRVLQSPHAGQDETRRLYHGTIEHGAQFLLPPRRFQPTTYYGINSGIGMVLRDHSAQDLHVGGKHVGVIGLGVGTLAAYGKSGDTYRFYEINHQVIDVAQSLFTYLRETKARVQIVEGDARLSLERDPSTQFDVIAVDAFSGDAIPVHLLTREAFALYLSHLRSPNGVLAFHVSNRYLDLAPIVRQLAREAGYTAILVRNAKNDEELISSADWVLVTRNNKFADDPEISAREIAIPARPGKRSWTDAYNNLFDVLKKPHFVTDQ